MRDGTLTAVFIVSSRPVMAHGLEHVLAAESGFEIVGLETDPVAAQRRISECAPGVILVDLGAERERCLELIGFVLTACTAATLVVLNLPDNAVVVCRGQRHEIRDMPDLLAAIRN